MQSAINISTTMDSSGWIRVSEHWEHIYKGDANALRRYLNGIDDETFMQMCERLLQVIVYSDRCSTELIVAILDRCVACKDCLTLQAPGSRLIGLLSPIVDDEAWYAAFSHAFTQPQRGTVLVQRLRYLMDQGGLNRIKSYPCLDADSIAYDAFCSVLLDACTFGSADDIKCLIEMFNRYEAHWTECFSTTDQLSHYSYNILKAVCSKEDTSDDEKQTLLVLLLQNGFDINAASFSGMYSVFSACCLNEQVSIPILRFLVQSGADPFFISYVDLTMVTQERVCSTLHTLCATRDAPEVVRYLLELGFPAHKRGRLGLTPLDMACAEGHVQTVALLLRFQH